MASVLDIVSVLERITITKEALEVREARKLFIIHCLFYLSLTVHENRISFEAFLQTRFEPRRDRGNV